MKNLWFRTAAVLSASTILLWLVYQGLLILFSESGKLSEFGTALLGYVVNIWSAFNVLWITTGQWWPGTQDGVPKTQTADDPNRTFQRNDVVPIGAVALLTVVWIAIWFYANLLQNVFLDGLKRPETLGAVLDENTAMRIATHFAGLLSMGIMLPLMSVSAFLGGWLSKIRLGFRHLLVPSALFILVAGALNSWSTVAATGLPPSYDAWRMIFKSSAGPITTPEIVLLWLFTVAVAPVVVSLYAVLGWFWSALGHRFRRVVVRNGDAQLL